jgi:general secretion pathway protein M
MINWWNSLSLRERILVGLGAVLVVAAIGWYGVWRPAVYLHQVAASRHAAALKEKQTVLSLVAQIRTMGPARKVQAGKKPLAEIVRDSLGAAGITPGRIEADPQGGVRVAANAISSTLLFPWIAQLQTEYGISLRHLIVVKEGEGTLNLDATLSDGR